MFHAFLVIPTVCIQTGHMDLIPPQIFQMLWQGFRSGYHTRLHQSIDWTDMKSPSSSFFNTSFIFFGLLYIIFFGLVFMDIEACPWVC